MHLSDSSAHNMWSIIHFCMIRMKRDIHQFQKIRWKWFVSQVLSFINSKCSFIESFFIEKIRNHSLWVMNNENICTVLYKMNFNSYRLHIFGDSNFVAILSDLPRQFEKYHYFLYLLLMITPKQLRQFFR